MGTESMPHVITGERDLVAAALDRARVEGRLVAVTEARVLADERVRVVVRLRAPGRSQAQSRWRWERVRPWLVVAGKLVAVLAALAAVAGLVWLVVLGVLELIALVMAVVAWVQAHLAALVVGAVALVVLLLAGLSRGSSCAGLHCGGCRR